MSQKKKKNIWSKIGVYIFVFAFVWFFYDSDEKGATPQVLPAGEVLSGLCVKVIDGDTVDVKVAGKTQRVRILGIDTMETYNEEKLAQQARRLHLSIAEVRRFGQEAKAFGTKQLLGKEVDLISSGKQPDYDPYDRLLAYVEVDGVDFGLSLLNEGLAEARREPHARSFKYGKVAQQVKRAGLGIFKGL